VTAATSSSSPSPLPIRRDGGAAKQEAFRRLHASRRHLIRKFQHQFLDHLLTHGEAVTADLDGSLTVPPDIKKFFVGAAVAELSRNRLTKHRKTPRYTRLNGRHGSYVESWILRVDRDTVESWKRSNPVSPAPAGPKPTSD
jgi:hypothetical protein